MRDKPLLQIFITCLAFGFVLFSSGSLCSWIIFGCVVIVCVLTFE